MSGSRGECHVCGSVPTLDFQLCAEHLTLVNHADRLAKMLRQCVGYENGPTRADETDLYTLGHQRTQENGYLAAEIITDARTLLDKIGEY